MEDQQMDHQRLFVTFHYVTRKTGNVVEKEKICILGTNVVFTLELASVNYEDILFNLHSMR